jgi:hypothetical protein
MFEPKQPLPPGANVSLASGPVITPTPRDETNAVLPANATQLMEQAPPGVCIRPHCGGRLLVRRGLVKISGAGGVLTLEDSPRCQRQSYVCCSKCGCPVPQEHVMQKQLDADWLAREALDRAEAERAAQQRQLAAAAPAAKAAATNSVLSLPDLAESLAHNLDRLRRDHEALTARVAVLERRLAEVDHPF